MNSEIKKTENLEAQLVAPGLDVAKANLVNLRRNYAGLVIAGPDDKAGMKTAKAGLKQVRDGRLSFQREVKSFFDRLKAIEKGFKSLSVNLAEDFKALEDELKAEIQRIADEIKQAEQLEAKRKIEQFNARTEKLFSVGFVFDGYQYKAGMVFITPAEIAEIDDDQFNSTLARGACEVESIAETEPEPEPENNPVPVMETPFDFHPIGPTDPEGPDDDGTAGGPAERPDDLAPWTDAAFDQYEFHAEQPATPQKPGDFRGAGFTAGFDACRNIILDFLETSGPVSRTTLKEYIRNLQL